MRQVIFFILLLFGLSCFAAEERDTQVLVFGKSGVTTLMYAEDLQSVRLSTIDTDNTEHSDYVSQDFVHKDGSVFKIMLADIDSVAFGNRNRIVPKPGAHEIVETDLPYISACNDGVISFTADTPADRIPLQGQYIYYLGFHEYFPWGLCGKVQSVRSNGQSSINVSVSDVPANEVFDKFFFAGDAGAVPAPVRMASRADADSAYPWKEALNFAEQSEFKLLLNAELHFSNVVADVIRGYYHADIMFDSTLGMAFKINLQNKKETGNESGAKTFRLPPLAWGAIQPTIEIGAFYEANAAVGIDYEMTRNATFHTEWTRQNGQNTFSHPTPEENPEEADPTNDEAKIAIVLDGNIFGGLYSKLSLNTLFDHLGAGLRVRAGAELAGEVSYGALAELSSDHTRPAVDGSIDLSIKLDLTPYWYSKSLFENEKDEHLIGEPFSLKFLLAQLNLFPNFIENRAVPARRQINIFAPAQQVCTAAAISETPIPYPLETGFELVNTVTNEVVDNAFTTDIEAFGKERQGLSAELNFATNEKINPEHWQVRPIFRYGEYILAGSPVTLNEGNRLSPFLVKTTRSGIALQSSFPAVGSHKSDNQVFEWCGTHNVRKIKKEFLPTTPPVITAPDLNLLNGTWKSTDSPNNIILTFEDDENGNVNYNGNTNDFTYSVSPTGEIRMEISEKNITRLILITLDNIHLTGRFKNQKHNTTFKRI